MHVTAITYFVPIDGFDYDDTYKCVKSFRHMVDRFIVIQNGAGRLGRTIKNLSDIYVINEVNKLMAGAVNQGYGIASVMKDTEYLMFIDNGVEAFEFDMEKHITDGIASPHIGSQDAGFRAHACCFVLHKDVFAKIGLWDSSLGKIADNDWFERAWRLGIPTYQTDDVVSHVHVGATTGRVDGVNIKYELV